MSAESHNDAAATRIECECCGETFPTREEAEAHAGAPDYCGFTDAELVEVEA